MARLIDYQAAVDRYYAEFEKQDICDGAQDMDWLKRCFDESPTIENDFCSWGQRREDTK